MVVAEDEEPGRGDPSKFAKLRPAFTADGTMTFDENKPDARDEEDHVSGPYTASDGVVTATVTNTNAPGHQRVTFTYYAGSVFSTHAMRAAAGHDGCRLERNSRRAPILLDWSPTHRRARAGERAGPDPRR